LLLKAQLKKVAHSLSGDDFMRAQPGKDALVGDSRHGNSLV